MNASAGRPWPWHVVLAPIVPVCGLLAANLMMIPPRAALVSIGVLLVIAIVLWQIATRLCADSRTGALVSTFVLLIVLSGTTLQRFVTIVGIGSVAGAIALCVASLVLLVWLLRSGDRRGEVTRFANVALLLLAVLLVGQIARVELTRTHIDVVRRLPPLPVPKARAESPDIYVLVLDGYGRADVLRELYGYDNPMVAELQSLGFTIPQQATSNYAQTALSIASLLNADYIQTLVGDFQHERDDRRLLGQLIRDNRILKTLNAAGYRLRAYSSEYPLIRPAPVDDRRGPLLPLTQFDYALYEETVAPWFFTTIGLPRGWEPARWHRHQIAWTLDDLEASGASDDRPMFVFAHVLLPHPPFVFTDTGASRFTSLPVSLNDGFEWRATAQSTTESYEAGYLDALKFVNARVGHIIEHAITRERVRGRPVVIYLQGDHGPGSRLHRNDAEMTDLHERHGIMLAVRLPHGAGENVYSTITPVNAMRVVLNAALGTRLEKLDDRAYFSTWDDPYAFIDVTNRVQ